MNYYTFRCRCGATIESSLPEPTCSKCGKKGLMWLADVPAKRKKSRYDVEE